MAVDPITPLDASSRTWSLFDDLETSGWIPVDAAHWQIEPLIPLDPVQTRQLLRHRGGVDAAFAAVDRRIAAWADAWQGRETRWLSEHYWQWDPDREFEGLDPASIAEPSTENTLDERESNDSRVRADGNTDDHDDPASRATTAVGPDPDGKPPSAANPNAGISNAAIPNAAIPNAATPLGASLGVDEGVEVFLDELDRVAVAAGYSPIAREQIEQCVGVASGWGVPLHIDLDQFEHLKVYARGDVIGRRIRRNWRTWYRRQIVEVPLYRRMIVAFQMKPESKWSEGPPTEKPPRSDMLLHLRQFKNIPKQDVDMLLPGSRVRISGVDRVKIIIPSLGGFLLSLRKIAQITLLLAALALHWGLILVAMIIGYATKSVLSYFQTQNRYQLHLTRNLYFQKLDANEGVLSTLVHQAAQQRRCEAMLAYHALREDDSPTSTRRLKRRCQRYLRQSLGIEVDFQIARALSLLVDIGMVEPCEGKWRLVATRSVK